MKHMSLQNIASACSGTYFGAEEKKELEITGVAIDSRNIEQGFLFVPIKGERVDGHNFIPQVMENGALCTLSEKELRMPAPLYSGRFYRTGFTRSCTVLSKLSGYQSGGNYRKCRKDKYKGNGCFRIGTEIFGIKNSRKLQQ